MTGKATETAEQPTEPVKIAVQFFCNDEEVATLKAAAEKNMRSSASFAKFHTLKAAQAVNEGKTLE